MAAPASSNSLQFASLYVGDLHPEVSEATLYEAFSQAGTVASCRVCRDNVTRKSLGYGYVNFGNVQEAERALEMLNYMSIKGKPCRVMWSQRDPERRKNTASNVFVKGLDPTIDNKALHDTFSIFGNILSCKVSTDDNGKSKGYGFVHYEKEEAAKEAILKVNGMKIADSTVFVGPFIKREERDDTINETFTNLYVRNMPGSWDDAKVAEIFGEFGEVSSSVLLNTDDGKRFALVNFKQPEAARAAVEALHKKDMRSEMGKEKADEAPESEKKDEAPEEKEEKEEEQKEDKEDKEDGKEEETEDKEGETGKEEHPEHLLYVQRAQTRAERKAALEEERKKRKEAKGEGKGKDKGVRLCIRNIAEEVTAEKLRELMEPFDTILAVILRCDEETGKNRGVGFVVMSSMEGATKAIEELNGQELEGKALNVAFSERRGRGERADGSTGKGKGEGKEKGGGRGKGKGKGGKGIAATIIPPPHAPFQAPPMMRPMGPMPGMPPMPVPGMPGGMPMYPFPQGPRGVPSMPGMPGMRPFGMPGQMPHPLPHRPMMPMPGAPRAAMPGMPTPMPPAAALGPFNKEAIEKMPPQQQKQQLGERLYASNFRLRPDLAGKLTGMMLELPNTEILGLLESDEKLKHKIDEAVKILDQQKK